MDDFKDFFPEESDWWYTVKSGTARSYWAVLSSPTAIFELPPNTRPASPPLKILGKVRRSKKMHVERPADKYLLRTNSKVRPYMCGFEGCGKTY